MSTPVLEVGVDYTGINEIIMYGDFKSPASYKQKAGRGAREGILGNGLFVMSIIQNSPLANFFFRHFDRLVNPNLTPIKLEVKNPNIVRTQSFAAVFDFLALKEIDLFNVREPTTKTLDDVRIEREYNTAIELLEEGREIREYLSNFLIK